LGINQALNPSINCNPLASYSQICIYYGAVSCDSNSYSYTIKSGDTCYSLGVSVASATNQNVNCANLQIGQSICIPYYRSTQPSVVSCGNTGYQHTIVSGDTCFSLGITYSGLDCSNLQIGTVVCVPYKSVTTPSYSCGSTGYQHTIVSGDTCNGLGISTTAGYNCANLQIGQIVCVPYRTATTTSVSVYCGPNTYRYAIRSGDTCNTIGITATAAQTQGINCANLVVGQVVCVPYNVVTTTQPSNNNYYCASGTYPYTVKSGDTCNTIGISSTSAQTQGISCANLQVGQVVCASYYVPSTTNYPFAGGSCGSNAFPYVVKSGENCYSLRITQAYATSNGINCNPLAAGSTICLPLNSLTTVPYYTTTTTMPYLSIYCGLNTYSYTIKNGDSCYSLGITQELAAAQNVNCNLLQVGQTICAPYYSGSTTPQASGLVCATGYYTVAPGDSCQSISSSRNYLYTDLIALNGGTLNCNTLTSNQVICV